MKAALTSPRPRAFVVRSLSGGTRRKVELVRVLLHRPRVLLMDETTVGLDPASRQRRNGGGGSLALPARWRLLDAPPDVLQG